MVDLLGEVLGGLGRRGVGCAFLHRHNGRAQRSLQASFGDVVVQRRAGDARFASLDEWLHTDIRGWTLSDDVDDEQFERLRRAATERLARFVGADGMVSFAAPALIATATAA
jgi:hypothetical protein